MTWDGDGFWPKNGAAKPPHYRQCQRNVKRPDGKFWYCTNEAAPEDTLCHYHRTKQRTNALKAIHYAQARANGTLAPSDGSARKAIGRKQSASLEDALPRMPCSYCWAPAVTQGRCDKCKNPNCLVDCCRRHAIEHSRVWKP